MMPRWWIIAAVMLSLSGCSFTHSDFPFQACSLDRKNCEITQER